MGYNLIAHDGDVTYGIKEYVVDTPEDIPSLPLSIMGSTVFVISTSEIYMMNSEKEWVKI